jgi:hypothetical protein
MIILLSYKSINISYFPYSFDLKIRWQKLICKRRIIICAPIKKRIFCVYECKFLKFSSTRPTSRGEITVFEV